MIISLRSELQQQMVKSPLLRFVKGHVLNHDDFEALLVKTVLIIIIFPFSPCGELGYENKNRAYGGLMFCLYW